MPGEWNAIGKHLEKLTLKELREIAREVGVSFTVENDTIRKSGVRPRAR